MIRRVAFAGLGQVGSALAAHLERAGYDVVRIDPAEGTGADVAQLDELEGGVHALCLCVPGPAEVAEAVEWCVTRGEERPAYVVNLSTIGPTAAGELDERLAAAAPRVRFAECPVVGGVVRVRRRESLLLHGSRDGALDDALRQLLEAMAARVVTFPDVASASVAKLANNVAAVSIGLATLEALELGVRGGVPLPLLLDVLAAGTASSHILGSSLTRVLAEDDLETGFALRLALKDMRIARAYAEARGAGTAHAALAVEELEAGARHGLEDLSFAAVAALRGLLDPAVAAARAARLAEADAA